MADPLTPQQRSAFMARIRSKDTKPELAVRKALFALGYRFRLHIKGLAGRPDVAFTRKRKVVFVHGCFWHGHEGCKHAHLPKTRPDYWREKFERNRARDAANLLRLAETGWDAHIVWECELSHPDVVVARLERFLGEPLSPG